MNKATWELQNQVSILATAAVAGPMEGKGQLKDHLDYVYEDLYADGQESWEKAERKMLEDATSIAVEKAKLKKGDIGLYLAGDLLNQNISASFSARTLGAPFIGVFGACSTAALSLSLASTLVDAGYVQYAVSGASSHNCTAEKQYRYPTEYGSQKPDTAQWTVTGAGASVVGKEGEGPYVRCVTIGKVVDLGVTNPFDMGSAMAPAAASTIKTHFEDTGRTPKDYDLIVTGDLSSVGLPIVKDLLQKEGYNIGKEFQDCGLMIYTEDQEVFAGASGCASNAIVTYGKLIEEMKKGIYERMLVVGTGALLSPISYQQGESIPCVAHAVAIERSW